MIGRSLGPYEVLEPLGAGGMGEVYRARDTKLDRDVAIKLLPDSLAADAGRLARFEREAKLLASLNHPRIASIYNMESEDGSPFLVLELVEGESLAGLLGRGPVPVSRGLRIGEQIAEALTAAHRAGIVHRDLKPANVMIAGDTGDVKVLDFGIAKAMDAASDDAGREAAELTRTGTLLGTTPYMSPEQLRGEPSDHRADIWAFGCLLFEVLTGGSPFARSTSAATVAAVLESDPEWNRLPRNTPDRVRALLQRCLDKDVDRRIARMRDAQIEVEATRTGAVEQGGPGRGAPGGPRGRWAVAGGVAAAAIVGLYAMGAFDGVTGTWDTDGGAVEYIAVLPFDNQSPDQSQDFVAASLTDQLSTGLQTVAGLRVLGRQSALVFDPSAETPVEFATGLDLDALVTGQVFSVGDDVRVSVQLLDGGTGDQIWSSTYDGAVSNMFAFTDSTVQAVGLQIGALGSRARPEASTASIDPEARSLYQLARYHAQDYSEDALARAAETLEAAIDIDENFAAAHGLLASILLLQAQQGYLPGEPTLSMARAQAQLAMDLDSTDATVLANAGNVRFRTGRAWDGLRELFQRAVELNPNSGQVWHTYSHFLTSTIEPDSALHAARMYREVDPLTRGPWLHLTDTYDAEGRWAEAIAVADSALEIYPDYSRIRYNRARALLELGRDEEAVGELEALLALSREGIGVMYLAVAYAETGAEEQARALLPEVEELNSIMAAWVHMALGDHGEAFVHLERAVDRNQGAIEDLLVSRTWGRLREHRERWRELLGYAGFSEELIAKAMAGRG